MEQELPFKTIQTEDRQHAHTRVVIFLGISAFFAVGLGGVLLGKYLYAPKTALMPQIPVTPTQVPVATPTPDSTVNWKTYTNGKLLFEFKYPTNLTLRSFPDAFQYDGRVSVGVEEKPVNPPSGPGCFEFIFTVIYASSDLQGYSEQLETDGESYKIKIGDREGLRLDNDPKIGNYCPSSKVIIRSRTNPNTTALVIIMIRPHNKYSELFDQILSTFRFTD